MVDRLQDTKGDIITHAVLWAAWKDASQRLASQHIAPAAQVRLVETMAAALGEDATETPSDEINSILAMLRIAV